MKDIQVSESYVVDLEKEIVIDDILLGIRSHFETVIYLYLFIYLSKSHYDVYSTSNLHITTVVIKNPTMGCILSCSLV